MGGFDEGVEGEGKERGSGGRKVGGEREMTRGRGRKDQGGRRERGRGEGRKEGERRLGLGRMTMELLFILFFLSSFIFIFFFF